MPIRGVSWVSNFASIPYAPVRRLGPATLRRRCRQRTLCRSSWRSTSTTISPGPTTLTTTTWCSLKGTPPPLLYAVFKAAGAISDDELLTFRKFGSRLQGHPTPAIDWVDVATGSLGQGLPVAVGVALAGKHLERLPYRVWVLCGDSEMAEGSMWEAFEHAAFAGLDNLTAIIDVNRLGQRGETMVGWDLSKYTERAKSFGWNAIEVDGHNLEQIDRAYAEAVATKGVPSVIVARTVKGKGVAAVENKNGAHGKALDDPEAAIRELGGLRDLVVAPNSPAKDGAPHEFPRTAGPSPTYALGDKNRQPGKHMATLWPRWAPPVET